MSDPVLDIESSEQDSSPREIVDIVHGTTTHRITFATKDIAHGSTLYLATPGARGEIGQSASGNTKELHLTLPIDHALVRRYLQAGNPPQVITVTLRRKYLGSSEIETLWVGRIRSMAIDDSCRHGVFVVSSTMSKHLLRVLPNVAVSRTCPHALYDTMCGISRNDSNPDGNDYKLVTTVNSVNGRSVRLDMSNVPAADANRATWAIRGELKHVASGEWALIMDQADLVPGSSTFTDLTLRAPIPGMKIGDVIEVYAGCARDIATCVDKFDNRERFGGLPQLPDRNPYTPEGVGLEGQ